MFHIANLDLKFLLINPNNLLGDDVHQLEEEQLYRKFRLSTSYEIWINSVSGAGQFFH